MGWGDADVYRQAGCTQIGYQYVGTTGPRYGYGYYGGYGGRPVHRMTWCCQPEVIQPALQAYITPPEYQRRKKYGLLAVAGILGLGGVLLYLRWRSISRGQWGLVV
jgi:hypothetical protein